MQSLLPQQVHRAPLLPQLLGMPLEFLEDIPNGMSHQKYEGCAYLEVYCSVASQIWPVRLAWPLCRVCIQTSLVYYKPPFDIILSSCKRSKVVPVQQSILVVQSSVYRLPLMWCTCPENVLGSDISNFGELPCCTYASRKVVCGPQTTAVMRYKCVRINM